MRESGSEPTQKRSQKDERTFKGFQKGALVWDLGRPTQDKEPSVKNQKKNGVRCQARSWRGSRGKITGEGLDRQDRRGTRENDK